jgi:hypothetical protein
MVWSVGNYTARPTPQPDPQVGGNRLRVVGPRCQCDLLGPAQQPDRHVLAGAFPGQSAVQIVHARKLGHVEFDA